MKTVTQSEELTCYARPGHGRAIEGRHILNCSDQRCKGCQRCTKAHCTVCHDQHADTVCTPCLHDTREDLHAIVELYVMAHYHAANAGRDSRLAAAKDIPGGNATVLIGPAGRDDLLAERRIYIRWRHGSDPFLNPDDEAEGDPEPVAYTLATWELWYRTSIAFPPPPARPNVRRSFSFLDDHLAELVDVKRPAFADLAADLRRQRRRIEDELTAGERDAVAAVDCTRCEVAYVRKYSRPRPARCRCPVWMPHSRLVAHSHLGIRVEPSESEGDVTATEARHTLSLAAPLWPRTAGAMRAAVHGPQSISCIQCHRDQVHAEHCLRDQGGLPDDWVCPKCGHELTDGQYKEALARDYRDNAQFLPDNLIEERTGIKAATVRKWASRGHLRRQGKDANGRNLYSVSGAIARRVHSDRLCGCPPMKFHASHRRDDICCWVCHIDATCPVIERPRGLRSIVAS